MCSKRDFGGLDELDEYDIENFSNYDHWRNGGDMSREEIEELLDAHHLNYECGARMIMCMFEGDVETFAAQNKFDIDDEETDRKIFDYILTTEYVTHRDDREMEYINKSLANGAALDYVGLWQFGKYIIMYAGVSG